MPILTESAVFDEEVTVPADGDARTVGSLLPALEVLTDRSRYLKTEQDAGARFVRRVATLTALKGLTGVVDGEVRIVDGLGLFQYFAAAIDASREPAVAVPTSIAGRWKHASVSTGVANGFATLASDAKVSAGQLRGFLDGARDFADPLALTAETTKAITSTSALTPDTLLTAPVVDPLSLAAGDQGILTASLGARLGTAAGVVFVLTLELASGDVELKSLDVPLPTATAAPVFLTGALGKLIGPDSAVAVKLQAYAATPGTVLIHKPAAFRPQFLHFRGLAPGR